MRKRTLTVETYSGPLPEQYVQFWADTYGGAAGCYMPEYSQPATQSVKIPGYIHTEPSYLHRFNKNDVVHESYSGTIPLKWRNFSTRLSAYASEIEILNTYGCTPGKISYFPLSGWTTVSLDDTTGLLVSAPDTPSSDGRPRLRISGIRFNIGDGSMRATNRVCFASEIDLFVQYWKDGRIGTTLRNRWRTAPITKGADIVNDPKAYLNRIRESLQFVTRDSIFPLYETGLDDALGNAVEKADGFHFSRLAAEIALDGLAVQSLQEIVRKMKRAPSKYATPLKKLTAVLKVLPSAYIGLQYGVLAPLRDYAKLPGALEQQFSRQEYSLVGTSISTYEDFTVNTRVSLQAEEPTDQQSLFELTYLLKGGFSLDDLWEVVPLSFVVDWFVNIGNLAKSTRFNEIYSKLNILYATVSRSYERVVTLDIDGAKYDVVHRIYTRQYRKADSLPSRIFSFTWGDLKGSWSVSNVDEAASMILSYLL